MVNDKRFELSEVKSPLLNPDFGNGLEKQFENIDANFKKIATAEYLRGRSGTTTHCVTIKLNRDDNSDTGIWYKNNDEAGQPVTVTSANILNKLEQVVGQTIEPTIDEQGNVNYPELILFIEDDNQGHKRAVSSMPFIYHDPELVDLLNNKDYQEQDFQDNSGIFLFNGDDFEKATSYPTLYYNKEIGEFCWIINGTETELIARGPQGAPGQNGTCLVVQIRVMSNSNTNSLPFGEQEVVVDGQTIKVPLMYPIKAIMLPDLEKGFVWKKLEDFTEDDPVTNYLHNDQIVIAIPNGGSEIELATNNTYSAITWACISPVVTKVGDMFEDGEADYFFVYANYSNSISNIVSNANLKWILRSVNTNSNDLKGLYVSNNPTGIENIEYTPDGNYEQTYFPNGVHMMHVDENNILNFKHTTKPDSTEKFGGDNHTPHVNFDYDLRATSIDAKDYLSTSEIHLGEGYITGDNQGNLSMYCNDKSAESSTIYNRITVRTIDRGDVGIMINGASSIALQLVTKYDQLSANDVGFSLYNKTRIEDSSSTYHYAIPIESSTYIDGGRNPYMLCCYDGERDYLSDYEGLKLIENGDVDSSCWKIISSISFKSGQPWFIKVDSLSPVSQIYNMITLNSHNYSIYGGSLYYKDINFSLIDIKNNICEWVCDEDNKVYYSQTPIQELGSNIVLMPKEIGEYSFNEIVGYVKSGESLKLSKEFVSEFKDDDDRYNSLLNSRIYINRDTYNEQANLYLDTWKGLMNYNMESIYPYRGKISTSFGTIDNYCQNYYINGQNILNILNELKSSIDDLYSKINRVGSSNPGSNQEYDEQLTDISSKISNMEAAMTAMNNNMSDTNSRIDTISNGLSDTVSSLVVSSMSSPDAQAAVAAQVVNSINNNNTVAKAIDVKMSNALTNPVSASYKVANDLVNTSVVNSLQQPEVKAQLNSQTQNYLQSNAGSTIIASGVSNAISNNAQTQLAIDTYVANQMATTSSIGESVNSAVMKAVATPAVQSTLVESIKDVYVTKEEFEDYKVKVNITEGGSNAS